MSAQEPASPAWPPHDDERPAVLCVDDHEENLTALSAILESLPIRLVMAHSGSQALKALLRENNCAVILLDVSMPEMDGIETAQLVKSRERTRHTPVIFLTAGQEDVAQAKRGYDVGGADYLWKPLDADIVRAKVIIFVELHRRGQQIARQAELLRQAERRQRELELDELRRRVERRYQNLGDAVPQLVLRASPDGSVDFANRRWLEFTGVTLAQATGTGWQRALHANDAERLVTQWTRAVADGVPFRAECRLRADAGIYRWFLCEGVPEGDETRAGRGAGLLASFTDVTDQKRIEEEHAVLLQREHMARLQLEVSVRRSDLLADAGHLLAQSSDAAEVQRRLASIVVERLATWCVIDSVSPEGVEQAAFAHSTAALSSLGAELARDAEPPVNLAVGSAIATRGGVLVPSADAAAVARALGTARVDLVERFSAVSFASAPLRARGEVIGVLTMVSGERAYVAADLALAVDLAQRAALAIDNARLLAEARQAILIREEFLSIASHELRTPLSALLLQMQSIEGKLKKPPFDMVRIASKLEIAQRQVERLNRLISELLDVSRIQAGRLDLDREDVDLTELVGDVIARFSAETERTHTPVTVNAAGHVMARVDRLRVDQVVTNLLHNAIKYGHGQPVSVDIEADDELTRIRFVDHGIGISAPDLRRIFGRFERAVSSRSYGGMGIGLYIVDQIVRAHGGEIRVESSLGGGSTFTVEFPREEPAVVAKAPRAEPPRVGAA